MKEQDPRLEILRKRGIVGEDAAAGLSVFDARGGTRVAHEALARQFGHDGVRVVLALLAGGDD